MEAVYSLKQLEDLGFEVANDDTEFYLQYVLDPENYFSSDYLYTEKVGMGKYRVIRYNKGLHDKLTNWQLELILKGE